ncbi:MAG: hypothetical protein F6J97_08035 [Leptolyngbya sp. SIO4C1]|nr:hypothetical protein [Leptolyngbya sp. SIO4C1]
MKQSSKVMTSLAPLKAAAKPVIAALKAPYGIAVLASVGVHGLLFAFGPSSGQFSLAALSEPAAEAERTVPLVELSAAEQQRLPSFTRPQLSTQLDSSSLKPLPTPTFPTFSARATPAPGRRPVPSTAQPALPSVPNRPPLSGPTLSIAPRRAPAPSIWAGTSVLPALPAPPQTPPQAAAEPPASSSMRGAIAAKPDPEAADGGTMLGAAGAARGAAEPDSATLEELRQGLPAAEADGMAGAAALGTDLEASVDTQAEAADDAQPEADAPEAAASELDAQIAAATSPEEASKLEALLADLEFDAAGTSSEAAEAARGDWLAAAQAQAGEAPLQTAEPATLPMAANFHLCVENPPVDGLVGVVVDADGAIAQEPALLRSTGYAKLDQEALSAVRGVPFEAAEGPAAYEFNIDVSYDSENCVEPGQVLQSAE